MGGPQNKDPTVSSWGRRALLADQTPHTLTRQGGNSGDLDVKPQRFRIVLALRAVGWFKGLRVRV